MGWAEQYYSPGPSGVADRVLPAISLAPHATSAPRISAHDGMAVPRIARLDRSTHGETFRGLRTMTELEDGLPAIQAAPADLGRLKLVVPRPRVDQREIRCTSTST